MFMKNIPSFSSLQKTSEQILFGGVQQKKEVNFAPKFCLFIHSFPTVVVKMSSCSLKQNRSGQINFQTLKYFLKDGIMQEKFGSQLIHVRNSPLLMCVEERKHLVQLSQVVSPPTKNPGCPPKLGPVRGA